jgi:hypothetical protein
VPQPGRPVVEKGRRNHRVMVNGPDDVYVERKGRIERMADRLFEGKKVVLHVMGWVGRLCGRGCFVDVVCLCPRSRSCACRDRP